MGKISYIRKKGNVLTDKKLRYQQVNTLISSILKIFLFFDKIIVVIVNSLNLKPILQHQKCFFFHFFIHNFVEVQKKCNTNAI